MSTKEHWETVYKTKEPQEVGWTQIYPAPSLQMIRDLDLPKSTSIIDIGGGDSHLAEYLLKEGFTDITVLDLSSAAIKRARKTLGRKSRKVKWIVSDILDFIPERSYDLWHDRAAFHFLTESHQIRKYAELAAKTVGAYLTIGTFSTSGPTKCSGLNIRQYDEPLLKEEFSKSFDLIDSFREDHTTPSGNKQNFIFGTFKKLITE